MSNVAAGKDTDDEGEKLNDVEKVLSKLNIKLRDSVGEWRNFEDVLDEVADKWEDFTEVQRSQIATAIAGTRQQETFRALMNNYDQVKDLAGVAADSMGSASERMDTYMESVEAKTNQLKTTWEEFIMNLGQSDSYKNFLDFLIKVLDNIPKIIDGIKILGLLWISFNSQLVVTKTIGIIEFFANWLKNLANVGSSIKLLSLAVKSETEEINKNTIAKKTNNTETDLMTQKTNNATSAINAEKTAMSTVGKATSSATTAISGMVSAITLLIAVTYAAVKAGIAMYEAENKITQEDRDNARQSNETAQSYVDEALSLQELKDKYDEVINSTKTAKEKKQDLIDLQSSMSSALDNEKDKVDLLTKSYSENTEAIEENIKKKLNAAVQEDEGSRETRENVLFTKTTNNINGKFSGMFKKIQDGKGDDVPEVYKRIYDIVKDRISFEFGQDAYKLQDAKQGKIDIYDTYTTGRMRSTKYSLNQVYDELMKYAEEDLSDEERKIINEFMTYDNDLAYKSFKEDVDSSKQEYTDYLAANKRKNQAEYFDEITEYQKMLDEREELYKKYLESESETDKEEFYEQLKDKEEALRDFFNDRLEDGSNFWSIFGDEADDIFSKSQEAGGGMNSYGKEFDSYIKKIDAQKTIWNREDGYGYKKIKEVADLSDKRHFRKDNRY